MKTLHGLDACPIEEITLCEVDGRLHSMKQELADISTLTRCIDEHPKIHITRDMLHPITSGDESRSLFLPVEEAFFKQFARVWYEEGVTEALRLTADRQRNNAPTLLASAAERTLRVVELLNQLRERLEPYGKKNGKQLMAGVSQVRDLHSSIVRCIAWHPHCTKLAVAAADDSVRIYSSRSSLVPILKNKSQRGVSCLAWRPLSASELAVGCDTCILIWTIDPNSIVTRPTTANSCLLRRVNHQPISSLAWSPRGELLVSAAVGNSTLHVWDIALDKTCPLGSIGYMPNTFLSWARDGSKLVSASTGPVFRVWEGRQWVAERWQTMTGRVQSACWSPCGTTLLFATSEETIVYALAFNSTGTVFTHNSNASPQVAVPVLDVSKLELPNGNVVGGLVQAMDWEKNGRHFAILFKDTNYVAIFTTTVFPVLHISPCCLISGLAEEVPNTISFQKNFDEGSCLAVVWSSGRLQYFPLVYSDTKAHKSPLRKMQNGKLSLHRLYTSM